MGNEASRAADGLSPQAGVVSSARAGSSSKLPTTPVSTPSARRAKSFSSFQSPPGTSSYANGNDNGSATTPRAAAAAALHKQQSVPPNVERTIQRMDKAIRKRVRGGITYNMKILIRGARGTGKTSLFQRLKGEPIPTDHVSTPQLQTATINWNLRTNAEENVKCEVWDVVDRGFDPLAPTPMATDSVNSDTTEPTASPFELNALQANSQFASVRASAAVAASIAGASSGSTSGSHTVATVDATTVDVYHETHGAIFLLDITKWHTLEYVRQQLELVPPHIPTLVLGNFRDCGNQRAIFKEDIQELLYGSNANSSRSGSALRRPTELLYFECSLLNCYGLKSLHQYFGVPFLQLKLATLRQQLRLVETEFAHLKLDVTANIAEQRYADYVDHIKATGSDIRTGRKVRTPSASAAAGATEHSIVVHGSRSGAADASRQERDIGVVTRAASTDTSTLEPVGNGGDTAVATELQQAVARHDVVQKDLEDLPERTHSLADQRTAALKLEHSESVLSVHDESSAVAVVATADSHFSEQPPARPSPRPKPSTLRPPALDSPAAGPATTTRTKSAVARSSRNAAAAPTATTTADEPMNLEDFQVPKAKNNDLERFYSSADDSSDDASDDDVVVPPSAALSGVLAKQKRSHKQQFLYSDSSSDDESDSRAAVRRPKKRGSPRRGRGVTVAATTGSTVRPDALAASPSRKAVAPPTTPTPATETPDVPTRSTDAPTLSPTLSDVSPSLSSDPQADAPTLSDAPSTLSQNAELEPVPPTASTAPTPVTARPVSPAARTSRSPSPRQRLETSRAHSPSAKAPSDADAARHKPSETLTEPNDMRASPVVLAAPESPSSGLVSPRRRLQTIKTSVRTSPGRTDATVETVALPAVSESPVDTDASEVAATTEVSESPVAAADDDELVVASDDIDAFFSDDNDDDNDERDGSADTSASAPTTHHVPSPTAAPVVERLELILSDDDDDADVEAMTVADAAAPHAVERCTTSSAADSEQPLTEWFRAAPVDEPVDTPVDALVPNGAVVAESAESHMQVSSPQSNGLQTAAAAVLSSVHDSNASGAAHGAATPTSESLRSTSRPSNDLDAFFSESDSDDGQLTPKPPAHVTKRHAVAMSDDDDDDCDATGRFATYDAQATRKSKAERRQERDEIRRLTASLHVPVDELPAAKATALGSGVSADVLAAIRAAQEEALRMLPPDATGRSGTGHGAAGTVTGGGRNRTLSNEKKREKRAMKRSTSSTKREKKRSSSSSSSKPSGSSRRRHEVLDSDNDM